MPFRITGLGQMDATIRTIALELPKRAAAALYLEANIIMTESKRIVPVDTGALKASGFVADPEFQRRNIRVMMAYGGAAKEYAIYVHEILRNKHPHGQAKYLEVPLHAAQKNLGARLAARINF